MATWELLRGVDPASGSRLRAPVRERTITVRTLDTGSGEWREERKRLAPVPGYDLVFSCPKSVSLLHALTDDERLRHAVSEAHEAAWQAALAYLESEACAVRRARGGAVRERALELAEQRLAIAEQNLLRLRWLGCRLEGAELRAEVGFRRTAVELARKQLERVALGQPELRRAPTRRARLEPAQPVPVHGRVPERSLALDL